MMTADQLKKSILQYAIEGKLVAQNPDDEPASVLLEKIATEKEARIKAGELKRDKNASIIYRKGNSFYERKGKEEVCIDDEIPFEIPESWEWARLSTLVQKNIKRGKSPKYADSSPVLVFAQKCNSKYNGIQLGLAKCLALACIPKYPQDEYMRTNDIVINSTGGGTMGRVGYYDVKETVSIVPDSHVTIVRPVSCLNNKFYYFFLKSKQAFLESQGDGSTNQTELRPQVIQSLLVPIPPLAEQHRIVTKLESLLTQVKAYEQASEKLTALNAALPEHLKKSILQYAIEGKLVAQNPDDEPASVLLDKIAAEKEARIKAGELKRDKNASLIYRKGNSFYERKGKEEVCIDDEIPFEIPESWEWARMRSVVLINPKSHILDQDVGFIPMTRIEEGLNNQFSFEVRRWAEVKKGYTHVKDGDMVFAKITPCFQNKKAAVMRNLPNSYGAATTEVNVFRTFDGLLSPLYLLYFHGSDYVMSDAPMKGTAGQQRVDRKYLEDLLIPIPPLAEQHRIVAKLDTMLSTIKKLQTS